MIADAKKFVDSLDDETRVRIFGLGDGAVDRIKSFFDSIYRFSGGNEKVTNEEVEEYLRDVSKTLLVGYGIGFGTFAASRKISEEYQFSKVPAISQAASTVQGMGAVFGEFLSTYEAKKHEYGQWGGNVASIGTSLALMSARKFVMARLRTALAAAAVKAAAGAAIPEPVTTGIGAIMAVAEIAYAIFSIGAAHKAHTAGYDFVSNSSFIEQRSLNFAKKVMAPRFMEAARITEGFELYRAVPAIRRSGFDNAYDTLERVIQRNDTGVSASMFGVGYEQMSSTMMQLALTGIINPEDEEEFAARTAQMTGLYGRDMTSTMASMSRLSLDGEISTATALFETFFSSMVSDGKIHLSQITLVEELANFAYSHGMGRKYVRGETAARNTASIHAFLTDSFGDKQTTAGTQSVIESLDDVLLEGAFRKNPQVLRIMQMSGITSAQAFFGVTDDAETFNKFLSGMYETLGIGGESFDENGEMDERSLEMFLGFTQHGLGVDPKTQRELYASYRSFVQGRSAEEISTERAQAFQDEIANALSDDPFIKLTDAWARGSRVLTDTMFDYTHLMIDIGTSIIEASKELFPKTVEHLAKNLQTLRDDVFKMSFTTDDSGQVTVTVHDGTRSIASPAVRTETLPNNIRGLASLAAHHAPRFSYDDARFSGMSLAVRNFQIGMLGNLAMAQSYRLTGVGGLTYDSNDPRLRNRINYGTDVVVGGRGSESPIYFPFNEGTVVYVGFRTRSTGENTYGLSVVINLDEEHQVSFSHLSRASVSVGDVLSRGDLIGNQGTTGQVTGAHVDIEFRRNAKMRGDVMTGSIIHNPEDVARIYSPFLGEYSIGGAVQGSGKSSYLHVFEQNSKNIVDYVNIDVELNGLDSYEFATTFANSFMR